MEKTIDEWIEYWEKECEKVDMSDVTISFVEKFKPLQMLRNYELQKSWNEHLLKLENNGKKDSNTTNDSREI